MISQRKIKLLSASTRAITMTPSLNFARVIQQESIFSSIEEALETFKTICIDTSHDTSFFISGEKILFVNTIQETLKAILHEFYTSLVKDDIEHFRHISSYIQNFVEKEIKSISVKEAKGVILFRVMSFLSRVTYLDNEILRQSKNIAKSLACEYYTLMKQIYKYLSKGLDKDYYSHLEYVYDKYLSNTYKERTRMGIIEFPIEGE